MLTQTLDALNKECGSKDLVIRKLDQDVAQLHSSVDDLEQHGRKDSVRRFGQLEDTPGTTDQKVLRFCNQMMKSQPLLTLDEIAISHCVGKVKQPAAADWGWGSASWWDPYIHIGWPDQSPSQPGLQGQAGRKESPDKWYLGYWLQSNGNGQFLPNLPSNFYPWSRDTRTTLTWFIILAYYYKILKKTL